LCAPGEGNTPHVREETPRGWRFKQWTQPYIHREAWVQARPRKVPWQPDPETTYAALVRVAQRVQTGGLVLVTSGDWDYRELVFNWLAHAHRQRASNALVLAMDRELFNELQRRRVPSFDQSDLLLAWNNTCMQRHIQRVRMERHVAVASLVAAGLDVLHTDASCVLTGDVVPYLRGQAAQADFFVQRDAWPEDPVRSIGTAANAGFYYVRAAKRGVASRFIMSAVERGMIEFYLRWNNIPDQYGLSFVMGGADGVRTSTTANETSVGTLHPRGSHCKQLDGCLKVGFLPYDRFPRSGRWSGLRATAMIYHLTYGCQQELAPCSVPGIRPFRGHRQRQDRYEKVDFDDQVNTLRELGLWLVRDSSNIQPEL